MIALRIQGNSDGTEGGPTKGNCATWMRSHCAAGMQNRSMMMSADGVSKTLFLSMFYTKTILLPRQARDKHRKSCKKKAVLQVYRLTHYTAAATSIRAKTEDEDAAPWLSLAVSSRRLPLHGRAEAQCE